LADDKSEPVNRLIQAMMRPEFYPHPGDGVKVCQTMMSWLLFNGQFVYKIKKPLQIDLFDASTPAKRYRLCQQELMLNRRLASDVYLEVRSIVEKRGSYTLATDSSSRLWSPRESVLVMRRLPNDRMLDQMVADGTATETHIQELAKRLAEFHMDAPIAKSKVWGSAEAISELVLGTLTDAQCIAADSMTRDFLAAAEAYTRRYLNSHQTTLDNRARDSRIREGHGDLRCDSVCFAPDGFVIIDCLEYSEQLRYCDVASELASLAVDLDWLGRSDLVDPLTTAYIAETNDSQLLDLLRFYKCYRAMLRGKLRSLASLQTDLPTAQRIAAREHARQLFALASSYAAERDVKLNC
jgi:uncharacterized protein